MAIILSLAIGIISQMQMPEGSFVRGQTLVVVRVPLVTPEAGGAAEESRADTPLYWAAATSSTRAARPAAVSQASLSCDQALLGSDSQSKSL